MNREMKKRLEMAADQGFGATDLWPSIERRAARRTNLAQWRPHTRLGWATLVVALALLVTSVAYAAAPLLVDIYLINPNWNPEARTVAHTLVSSQTVDGVTVTVERIYVDEKRVLIETSVTGPEGMSLAHSGATLYTADGLALPWVSSAGNVEVDLGEASWVLEFDATLLEDASEERKFELLLNVNGIEVVQQVPLSPSQGSSDAMVVELEPLPTHNYGPFRLQLRIPGDVADKP